MALAVAIRASDHLSTAADSAVVTDVPFAMLPLCHCCLKFFSLLLPVLSQLLPFLAGSVS